MASARLTRNTQRNRTQKEGDDLHAEINEHAQISDDDVTPTDSFIEIANAVRNSEITA